MEEDKNVSRDDSRKERGVWSASECRTCLCLLFGSNVGGVVVVVEVIVVAEKSVNVDSGAYNASLERVPILPVPPPSPSRLLVLVVLLIIILQTRSSD